METSTHGLAASLIAAACVAGCGDDEVTGGASRELTAVTYNAGLAVGFVDLAAERAPQTLDAIDGIDANVVCLQEVWDDEFVSDVETRAADRYASIQFVEPMQETSDDAACQDQAAIDAVETCALANCENPPTAQCVATCSDEFDALTPDCQSCAASQLGNTIEDIVATCTSGSEKYTFGGAFGIGLLAQGNVVDTDFLLLESNTIRRGVLFARVESSFGTVDAFCTHLTADLSSVPFPGTGSWAEEQASQIDALLAFIDEKSGGAAATLLMGDLNTGPAIGSLSAELPANYEKIAGAGYRDFYADDQACTFCADNPLVAGGTDESASVLIDHVLLGPTSSSSISGTAVRVLDQPITVDTADGPVDTALSDHYGLRATLQDGG